MRRKRLFLAAGACLATVALALGAAGGTAVADPVPAPPPYPPVVGVGAQTTQNLMNDLCNNIIKDGSGNRICQSWDNAPQPSTIKTRDGAGVCEISRPSQGGSGFDSLIANPTCVDFARVVTATDKPTRPAGFTYIPMATDTLTYAFRGDGTVPPNLSDATLKRIYQCDPALTFPSNANGFRPLIGVFGAGNRTFFFQKLGITDSANYTTLNPCVHDTDASGAGILANDGRYLTHPRQLITYSVGPYLAQITKAEADIHGNAVLGSINGISPLDENAFGARPVYNVVRTFDIDGVAPDNQNIKNLFVGPGSQVCTNTTAIKKAGFSTRADCGSTTLVSGP